MTSRPDTVLWLDDDRFFSTPFVEHLTSKGIEVILATTLSEAEHQLASREFDLLILDVMIPIRPSELREYASREGDSSFSAGHRFFLKHMSRLREQGTRTIVFTTRLDVKIAKQFQLSGVEGISFIKKLDIRSPKDLMLNVEAVFDGSQTDH